MNTKNLSVLIGTAIILALIAVPPVSSALVNGTFYWRNITPQNDIYEKVVMPGDTIVLGRTYDLTYVSGSSKKFAWWKDKTVEAVNCKPDIINSISYIDTNGKIRQNNVTLNPENWTVGDWWQWDGCFQMKFQQNHIEPQYQPYYQDNNLMFHVIYDPNPPTPVPTTIITTVPPTTTKPPTLPPMTKPTPPVPKDESWPWWYYPIGIISIIIIGRIIW